jgi:hypothetical protein
MNHYVLLIRTGAFGLEIIAAGNETGILEIGVVAEQE